LHDRKPLSGATKKTHQHKEGGWLASSRGSKYKKKHIVAKDVVGLLIGEVVSTKKKHIITKDVVCLPVGDSKNNREFD
jgi:hypothetical protein